MWYLLQLIIVGAKIIFLIKIISWVPKKRTKIMLQKWINLQSKNCSTNFLVFHHISPFPKRLKIHNSLAGRPTLTISWIMTQLVVSPRPCSSPSFRQFDWFTPMKFDLHDPLSEAEIVLHWCFFLCLLLKNRKISMLLQLAHTFFSHFSRQSGRAKLA